MRPARAQAAHDLVQPLDLLGGQAGGRLVEDDEVARRARAPAGSRPAAAWRAAAARRWVAGLRSKPASRARRSNRSRSVPAVDEPGPPRLGAEEDVLGDGQRCGTRATSWATRAIPGASASRGDRNETGRPRGRAVALVRREDAGDDLAERRLAGAVLADEGVDRCRPDGDRDVVEGAGGPEGLAEPADVEVDGVAGLGWPPRQPTAVGRQPGHSASGRKVSTLALVTTPPSGSASSGSTPGDGRAGPDGLDELLGAEADPRSPASA